MEQGKKEKKVLNGRWTAAEHKKFMHALEKYGRNWALVQKKINSRTLAQVRSHAQKCFLNMNETDIDALIGFEGDSSEMSKKCKTSISSTPLYKEARSEKSLAPHTEYESQHQTEQKEVSNSEISQEKNEKP